jgi:hypothetical protein
VTSADRATGGRGGAAASRVRTSVGALVAVALVGAGLTTSTASADVAKPAVTSDKRSSTALEVDWADVKGAASYKVQYSTEQGFGRGTTTLPAQGQPAISDSKTAIEGLSTGEQYFVRVAPVAQDGKVGTWSAATAATPTYSFASPGDLYRSRVDRDSMTVSWKAVSGAPGYTVRVYSKGNPTKYFTTTTASVGLRGLKAGTTYYIRAYVVRPAAGSAPEKRLSPDSLEVVQATTRYALATPDGFKETSQAPTSVALAWTAVAGAPAGSGYKVSYALNGAQTEGRRWSGVVKGTSARVGGLKNDTTYYATVQLVDAKGKQISGASDFIVAKSVVPRGRISGKVSGVTGSDLTAAAYTTGGDVAQAVTVGSDNRYTLDVRPGTYKVQLMYTGTGDFASTWARADRKNGVTFGSGSAVKVALGKTTTVPDVTVRKGRKITGKTVDRSGRVVPNVDLTAIAAPGKERDVVALTRSNGQTGTFAIKGLAPGTTYWVRAVYAGDGFRTESIPVRVNADLGVRVVLDTMPFRKRYKAYIKGTGRVGKTLSVHATPWLAGSYPTTRASLSYQWKRDGKAIKGATKIRYKLGKADRGKRITITVTAKRYGYTTGSATSKSKKVS